jgi:hypothetical protein
MRSHDPRASTLGADASREPPPDAWSGAAAAGATRAAADVASPRANEEALDLPLAVRCAELHTYHVGGCLMERDHKDSGSALTMSVCLTPCARGGKFLTWDGDDKDTPVVHECARGDAVLFRSEDYHNVSPVAEGIRQTLVIELWAGGSNKVDRNH